MKIFLLVTVLFVSMTFMACNSLFNGKSKEVVLAEVGGKKLTRSELIMALPANMVEVDSIEFSKKFIEKWLTNQLLLQKAELNLDKSMQNEIDIMIDNYRTSLMLYKYQQMFIYQKLDTVITDDQVLAYYNKHSENFKIDSSVVKAIFIQMPKSVADRSRINGLINSTREEDMIALEDYCYQKAQAFEMGENWQYFGAILNNIPKKISDPDQFLKSNNYIEVSDSAYIYYVAIKEFRTSNDIAPLVFVQSKIRDIIFNHRKVKLIDDLEKNIYNDAADKNKFIIHSN